MKTRLPPLPARAFAWSRLGSGSVPRLIGGYLVLRELGRSCAGASVPGQAVVAQPQRELEGHEAPVGQERAFRGPVHARSLCRGPASSRQPGSDRRFRRVQRNDLFLHRAH